jgi:NodT family efflux transporter outer membrane factor (OMF) lipoprotein
MDVLRHFPQFHRLVVLSVLSALLSSCMVGPNFHSPRSPHVKSFTETPMPAKTAATPAAGKAGKPQSFVQGQNIPAEWWYLFHSKELNQLITCGLANSPNLAAAYAALRVAQENLNVQVGNLLFPAFNAGFLAQRQRFSSATIGGTPGGSPVFNLFNASVNVAYTLDFFGGNRRQVEGFSAQVDYQQFQLIAAYLTLTSNIVTTSVAIASYKAQIDATIDLIDAQAGQLRIMTRQLGLGGVSRETVLTQQTLVEQTRATLPPLQKSLSQARHALAALVGTFPDRQLPEVRLNALILPGKLPVSLPSNLVRQRPDVRASEALLHSAMTGIGVATANLLPQFTISGVYGWETSVASQLFSQTSKIWSMATNIAQPIFRGGALWAQRRQAIASYEQAAAQYRQTVLTAFQNVADVLRALETDARTLRAQQAAEVAARQNLYLSQQQYGLGGVSYLTFLNAQQQYQSTRIAVIQAKAARYADTAALFQALGGGWWNKEWCVKECFYGI